MIWLNLNTQGIPFLMKYIINLNLVFDPDARVLALKNDINLSVDLSKPATRLLSELIIHNNVTLVREDLIKTVWVDYGFSPSHSSLSNHISELRKAFESLGLNREVIITVPRTGFRMEAEIHPITKSDEIVKEIATEVKNTSIMDEILHYRDEQDLPQTENRPDTEGKFTRCRTRIFWAIGLLSVSVVAGIIFFILSKKDVVKFVATKEKCNIYSLNNLKPPAGFIKNVNNMIETEGIDCTSKAADIYYTDTRLANDLLKVHFMAVCYKNSRSYYQNCTNYKVVK